jgi:type VI secretion system protein ImpM
VPDLAALNLPARVRQGWFGKLPGYGDFVRSALPEATVAAWDHWVRAGLDASRAVLGQRWLEAYLEAPVWRFRLAPGLCGASGLAGVMAPSVDRAGRYFPLMLGAAMALPPEPEEAADWFDALAEAATRAVVEDWTQARLSEALAAAGRPPEFVPREGATFATTGAPRVAPAVLRFPSLPSADRFAAFLEDEARP